MSLVVFVPSPPIPCNILLFLIMLMGWGKEAFVKAVSSYYPKLLSPIPLRSSPYGSLKFCALHFLRYAILIILSASLAIGPHLQLSGPYFSLKYLIFAVERFVSLNFEGSALIIIPRPSFFVLLLVFFFSFFGFFLVLNIFNIDILLEFLFNATHLHYLTLFPTLLHTYFAPPPLYLSFLIRRVSARNFSLPQSSFMYVVCFGICNSDILSVSFADSAHSSLSIHVLICKSYTKCLNRSLYYKYDDTPYVLTCT